MTPTRHLDPVPNQHPERHAATGGPLTISALRDAGQRANWSAEQLARTLGIGRSKLFALQRECDVVPEELAAAAERTLVLAETEAQDRERAEEQLTRTLAAWSAVVRAWVSAMVAAGERSTATIEGYRLHVSWLARDLATSVPDPWSLQAHVLEDWLDSHNWSAETRRKVLVSLRAFYSWGLLGGHLQRSPLSGMSAVPAKRPGPQRHDCPVPWVEPLRKFVEYLHAGGREPSTRKAYEYALVTFANHHADPWSVTMDDLVRYVARPDLAPNTRRHLRKCLQGFYRWAEDADLLPAGTPNPAQKMPVIRVRRALPRPAPDDAVTSALSAADHRTYLMLNVAIYTGMRRSEIAQIHTDDIGDDAILVHGKNGTERLVPLHPDLVSLLRTELRRRHEGRPLLEGWGPTVPPARGWLFPSTNGGHLTPHHLAKCVSAVLPGRWTTHTLRHRFATQALRHEHDLRAVQELLGHAKPETTAIYTAVPGESLRSAIAGVGPASATWSRP